MTCFTREIPLTQKDCEEMSLFDEGTIFYDIETTGLSSKRNFIYLIGCACRKEQTLCIRLFFAESRMQEAEILTSFFSFLSSFQKTISFNGLGFDLPFLLARSLHHNLPDDDRVHLQNMTHYDLLVEARRFKKMLSLSSCRQKAIEEFLGISREDRYSGGELISCYLSYEKSPSKEAEELLLLHNYEDVLGMTRLLPLAAYSCLPDGRFAVADCQVNPYTDSDGAPAKELRATLTLPDFLPREIFCHADDQVHLAASGRCARIRIRIFKGTLRHFYSDYQNYYYLPKEDMAIHKSVAAYVDRSCRQKATAQTCYTPYFGLFLPDFSSQDKNTPFAPSRLRFQESYHTKEPYLALTEDFLSDPVLVKEYLSLAVRIACNS